MISGQIIDLTSTVFGPLIDVSSTALSYAGRCAVPSILFTLGAQLDEAVMEIWPKRAGKQKLPDSEPEGLPLSASDQERMPLSAYVLVLVLRQVLGPLFGAALALGGLRRLC